MRKLGLSLALAASAQLTLFSTFSSPAFAEGPAAPAAAAAQTPAAPPPAPVGMINVHIKSDTQVTLQHRVSPAGSWEIACSSPCDTNVPVGDEFEVTGEGLNPSAPFHLDGSKGTVTLDVTAGKKKAQKTGVIVAVGGAVLGVAGILVMALGAKPSSTFNADGTTSTAHTNDLFLGGALVLGGVIAGIYGGAMIVNNGSSAVAGDVSKPPPARGDVEAPSKVAQIPAPAGASFIVPILHGSF